MDETRIPAGAPEPAQGTGALSETPKRKPNYFWAAVILGAILTVITYSSDPYSVPYTVFITACIMVLTTSNLKTFPINCITLFIIGVFLVIAMPNIDRFGYDGVKNAEVKANLHSIQLALERYAEQHTHYPGSIAALLADPASRMDALPANPYSTKDKRPLPGLLNEDPSVMQPINEIGVIYLNLNLQGQFCYLPDQELIDGQPVINGYRLVAFGAVSQPPLARYFGAKPGAKVILTLEGGECFVKTRALERSMNLHDQTSKTDSAQNTPNQPPPSSPEQP